MASSANPGKITVGILDLHVTNFELVNNGRLAEVTDSSSNGSTEYAKVVDDNSWSCEAVFDSTNLPDTDVGLASGAIVNITFTLGASSKTSTLTGTTVETYRIINNNQGDVVRASISGKGGALTRATT